MGLRIMGSSADVYLSWVLFALVVTVLYEGVNVIFAVSGWITAAERWRKAFATEVAAGERKLETAVLGKEHAGLRGAGRRGG